MNVCLMCSMRGQRRIVARFLTDTPQRPPRFPTLLYASGKELAYHDIVVFPSPRPLFLLHSQSPTIGVRPLSIALNPLHETSTHRTCVTSRVRSRITMRTAPLNKPQWAEWRKTIRNARHAMKIKAPRLAIEKKVIDP